MEFDPNELDHGIRKTVLWLNSKGFVTTDSGDGVSKEPTEDCAVLANPHVFIKSVAYKVVDESHYLKETLREAGLLHDQVLIEASYSPLDLIAIIAVYNLQDSDLEKAGLSV